VAARIKDIAKRANVSEATVSLVLNQKPGVKNSTRERVLQIAREMNYGATQRIALNTSAGTVRFLQIAMHGHTVNRDHNVFIADYIDGLTQSAREQGHKLEVSAFRDDSAADIAASILDSGLKGAVVLGTELSVDDITTLGNLKIPVVFLDTFYDFLPFDFVDMNNKDSVYTIIQHLVENGHKDIGFVRSAVDTHNFQLRDTGFWEAVQALNLDIKDRDVFTVDSTLDGAYKDMHEQLKSRSRLPTALFCTNDIIAYGVIRAIREHDLRIPADISIVAFDDLPASAVMVPPLTTIRVQKKAMGELAVQLLSRRIGNGVDATPVKIKVGGQLIDRSSVKRLK
jgi:LacI family transcriptional regulator, galactose operon repressor